MEPTDLVLAIFRAGIGGVLLAHGVNHAGGRVRTTRWFGSMGFLHPDRQWLTATAVELACGALLVLGLLTGLAAAGLVAVMGVAFWTVHRRNGFFIFRPGEGWEYVATLALAGLTVAVLGPGALSVDHATGLAARLDGWVGGALVAGGLIAAALQITLFWRPTRPGPT